MHVVHSEPLPFVRVDINGRRIATTTKARLTLHVPVRLLRQGRKRPLIAVRDKSGRRVYHAIVFATR